MSKDKKIELFLDSGAFSAWSQNVEIDIQKYISFIKKHQDVIDVYANLDDINSPERTWRNQMIMERAGLNPVPVYHAPFEDPKWLRRYMNRGYDYIALGGMAGGTIKKRQIMERLDLIFPTILCDKSGMPKVKVHGFGLTSLDLMLRYPWYSVDSTSWVVTGRLGSIFVPRYKNRRWIYDKNSWKIAVSNRSPATKEAGKHFETLPPLQKQLVVDYLKDKGYVIGKSEFKEEKQSYSLKEGERWAEKKPTDENQKRIVEVVIKPGVSNTYQLRDEINIIYFLDLEKSMPEWPWPFKQQEARRGFFE